MFAPFQRGWLAGLLWVLLAPAAALSAIKAHDPTDASATPPAATGGEKLVEPAATAAEKKVEPGGKVTVYVVPVREEIGKPILYILRRGLKEAIERHANVVVLDMQTPGGRGDVAFDMMEALEKFPGLTLTYVDSEAMSAGAFIAAATKEIWFTPRGVIGAAAAVTAEGQDLPETMRLKINSYLRGKIRAISENEGYRGQVISAMIDKDYELKIGDTVIKPKGELLSLTATEASKTYGDPPRSLLAAGIARDIDDLLRQKYGADGFEIVQLNVTWSEQLAVWLNAISPVLMGLGVICLIIEFKTPGFGFFGIAGIVLLALVFLGHYVAGFSGHEPVLLFGLGLLLVAAEVIFFPGIAVLAMSGVVLILASLVWAMADIWPNEPLTVAVSGDILIAPLLNLGAGLVLAVVLGVLAARFLPKGWVWDRMVLQGASHSAAQFAGSAPDARVETASLIGARGVVVTGLFPGGQIEIGGRRYQAKLEVGSAPVGAVVVVKRASDFNLVVEVIAA